MTRPWPPRRPRDQRGWAWDFLSGLPHDWIFAIMHARKWGCWRDGRMALYWTWTDQHRDGSHRRKALAYFGSQAAWDDWTQRLIA